MQSRTIVMRPARCRAVVASALLALAAAAAQAAGPIEVRRDKLPKAIARLHACVPARGMTEMDPTPVVIDRRNVLFSVACPVNGPGVVAVATREAFAMHDALYLARNKKGAGAKRLVLPYPKPDGSEIRINVVPEQASVGWSTREHTSKLTGAAFFDLQERTFPKGEFHLSIGFTPADRPHLKNAMAIWHVRKGAATLIYWAETTEGLKGEYPHFIYPKYVTVLDKRPVK
jgi:hypothetical protein